MVKEAERQGTGLGFIFFCLLSALSLFVSKIQKCLPLLDKIREQ